MSLSEDKTHTSPRDFSLDGLKRITSSGAFIPEIDGLRFIAIAAVVFYHINGYLLAKSPGASTGAGSSAFVFDVFKPGWVGVQLFFVISGFILGLPFAMWFIEQGKPVSLRRYYLRRVTRLEPPYFLTTLLFFLGAVFVARKGSFAGLFSNLLASLTYTHNLFWPKGVLPSINGVTWSLEIEVQFYVLAPLIALVFLTNKIARRSVLVGAIALKYLIFQHTSLPHLTVLELYDFFIAGFLLADMYVCGEMEVGRGQWLFFAGATVVFLIIWTLPLSLKGHPFLMGKTGTGADTDYFMPLSLLIPLFYYCIFRCGLLRRALSHKLITAIGGMCYSIYLVHQAWISLCGRFLTHGTTHHMFVDYALRFMILILAVVAISIVCYKIIEQPCMRPTWPHALAERFRLWKARLAPETAPPLPAVRLEPVKTDPL